MCLRCLLRLLFCCFVRCVLIVCESAVFCDSCEFGLLFDVVAVFVWVIAFRLRLWLPLFDLVVELSGWLVWFRLWLLLFLSLGVIFYLYSVVDWLC